MSRLGELNDSTELKKKAAGLDLLEQHLAALERRNYLSANR